MAVVKGAGFQTETLPSIRSTRLKRGTKGTGFNAVLHSASTSMSIIARNDHDRALETYPTLRHHSLVVLEKLNQFHDVMKSLRVRHNHPSGDPTPSRADIDMTRRIIDVAKPLGIEVHDHIIVGKDGHASLKGLRLI